MKTLIIVFFISNLSFAQYWGGQEINESDLSPWLANEKKDYAGNYRFGESESESDFYLFFSGGFIIGQIRSGYWNEDATAWKSKFVNLTNIKIDKNGKFTSDQHSGQFIKHKTEDGKYYNGLRINNPWSSWIEDSKFEIGIQTELVFENIYYGKYGKVSFKKLTKNDLMQVKYIKDFTIMRNEIYARYGYIFIKGGKMDTYFRKQDWYTPKHKNVNRFLTELERYNIEMIKRFE